MTGFLIKKFISGSEYSKENGDRMKYSLLSGWVGIFCNLFLCIMKFAVGALTGSVSITADAANNLSDASSGVITIAGAKLSEKPVDKEHPFGHGRMEYISAFIVSFFILFMGLELAKTSIAKLIYPKTVSFSSVSAALLIAAIIVKLWMAYFNKKLYRITGNLNMNAVKQDSLNDCIATASTLAALFISAFTPFKRADGIIGTIVAGIIIITGVRIARDTLNPLLGQPPKAETVKKIEEIMLKEEYIVGVHDLIVHDYGPGRIIASVHAEVPDHIDIVTIHSVIDRTENKISAELNILICVHMDPVKMNDTEINTQKEQIKKLIEQYDPQFAFHDFRMVKKQNKIYIFFDLVVPYKYPKEKSEIMRELQEEATELDKNINLIVTVEHSYI